LRKEVLHPSYNFLSPVAVFYCYRKLTCQTPHSVTSLSRLFAH